jgi:hypothetical protein
MRPFPKEDLSPGFVAHIKRIFSAQEVQHFRELAALAEVAEVLLGKHEALRLSMRTAQVMQINVLVTGGDAPSFEIFDHTGAVVQTIEGEAAVAMRLAMNRLQTTMAQKGLQPFTQAEMVQAVVADQLVAAVVAAYEM